MRKILNYHLIIFFITVMFFSINSQGSTSEKEKRDNCFEDIYGALTIDAKYLNKLLTEKPKCHYSSFPDLFFNLRNCSDEEYLMNMDNEIDLYELDVVDIDYNETENNIACFYLYLRLTPGFILKKIENSKFKEDYEDLFESNFILSMITYSLHSGNSIKIIKNDLINKYLENAIEYRKEDFVNAKNYIIGKLNKRDSNRFLKSKLGKIVFNNFNFYDLYYFLMYNYYPEISQMIDFGKTGKKTCDIDERFINIFKKIRREKSLSSLIIYSIIIKNYNTYKYHYEFNQKHQHNGLSISNFFQGVKMKKIIEIVNKLFKTMLRFTFMDGSGGKAIFCKDILKMMDESFKFDSNIIYFALKDLKKRIPCVIDAVDFNKNINFILK